MSVSRLAALGAALLAGATLAACSSSGTPIAPTGNNNQINSFPGAPVRFIQGSPNLHLGLTAADFYVDGQKVVTLGYLNFTPDILSLPAGSHTVTLYQVGTTNPLFSAAIVTLSPNTKYAIVAEGNAGATTTALKPQIALFIEPHYNTPVGGRAVSVFNASPDSRNTLVVTPACPFPPCNGLDFWYNCANPNGPCVSTGFFGTLIGSGITVGTAAAAASSSKNNVLLKASPTSGYCFGAYPNGSATIMPEINAPTGPPNATWPAATTDDPQTGSSCPTSGIIGVSTDTNFYVLDAPSTGPLLPAQGPSTVIAVPDSNG